MLSSSETNIVGIPEKEFQVFSVNQRRISFSEKEDGYRDGIKQKAELLRERARDCNRRKDILHHLLSYPMKPEKDPSDLYLIREKFINLNQMIKRLDDALERIINDVTPDCNTRILVELMETDIPAALEHIQHALAKYDFDIKPYDTSLEGVPDSSDCVNMVDSGTVRQMLHTMNGGQLKVIGICGQDAWRMTRVLEDQPRIRSMFELVISVSISQCHSIGEVLTCIAEELHRLVGTDISLPLEGALKPYKFVLFLYYGYGKLDLCDLKIPGHGSVVLAVLANNVYRIMPVDVEIRMEDHQLPWNIFMRKAGLSDTKQMDIKQMAKELVEACDGHLCAIILLAVAPDPVSIDFKFWKLVLEELRSSSRLPSMVEGMNQVMVHVLKCIWERKSDAKRHCTKHCISFTEGKEVRIVSCWIKNDLIATEEEGNIVLDDLTYSFLLEKVGNDYVRMRQETRDILFHQFIPHLHPLQPRQECLAEWDAKEINLTNKLCELREKPNFPSIVQLSLHKNYDLMVIPPSFFQNMPKLEVLDLSYTSIKTLPPSIARLFSLRKLLLRGCELLMELPHEIVALWKLQVLDLEGTKIMYLPKGIVGFKQLECLKVSLYEYGKCYRDRKQIVKRIPQGLLARLYKLEVISIDVNPDDEEWAAEIKDIIYELLRLRKLTTLKLYLPHVGLLGQLISVPNFKLTVGHHKQRIVSCQPDEVEEEFEKQDNYLRYINGEGIPTEIQEALNRTSAFFLERHWTVEKLSEFGSQNMVGLKFCLLVGCNELQTIIDGGELWAGDRNLVLGSLEYLGIHCMMNLKSIWKGAIYDGCLSKLKYLALHDCPNMTTIFTTSLLRNLDNLEELKVEDCSEINSLATRESSFPEIYQFLPRLRKISLLDLPELVSISNGLLIAPKLERIIIYACPMLESLSPMELSSTDLKEIKGEVEWWDTLKWNEFDWSSQQEDFLSSIFVELERDASLMDQLA